MLKHASTAAIALRSPHPLAQPQTVTLFPHRPTSRRRLPTPRKRNQVSSKVLSPGTGKVHPKRPTSSH
jgi:hypothetical protein